jgi:hypothetical protein
LRSPTPPSWDQREPCAARRDARGFAAELRLVLEASLRDVQDSARHADPSTTRRYDRGRHWLDRHAPYALAAYVG